MGAGELGGFSGGLCVRMYFPQREIAEYKAEALAEVLLKAFDDRMGVSTMGTFLVAVLDQRAFCVWIALDMICGADGHFERSHEVLLFRVCVRTEKKPPSAAKAALMLQQLRHG